MSITQAQFAQAAILALGKGISYQQEDCQAFVEQTVKRAGGKPVDYRGSNDMYRRACAQIQPLGRTAPPLGALLFIVARDGGEPDRYKADGLGNASHVGIYTDSPEVMHSSKSKGGVAASTLNNGWTHWGLMKGIDYDGQPAPEEIVLPAERPIAAAQASGNILLPVRLRKTPEINSRNIIRQLKPGENFVLTGETRRIGQNLWAQGRYRGKRYQHTGWAVAEDDEKLYINLGKG